MSPTSELVTSDFLSHGAITLDEALMARVTSLISLRIGLEDPIHSMACSMRLFKNRKWLAAQSGASPGCALTSV